MRARGAVGELRVPVEQWIDDDGRHQRVRGVQRDVDECRQRRPGAGLPADERHDRDDADHVEHEIDRPLQHVVGQPLTEPGIRQAGVPKTDEAGEHLDGQPERQHDREERHGDGGVLQPRAARDALRGVAHPGREATGERRPCCRSQHGEAQHDCGHGTEIERLGPVLSGCRDALDEQPRRGRRIRRQRGIPGCVDGRRAHGRPLRHRPRSGNGPPCDRCKRDEHDDGDETVARTPRHLRRARQASRRPYIG
jgi:hypothetical protein